MNFLMWVEGTSLAEYIRVSAYGYPAMITLHALGMAIMVGLSSVLCLRALGLFTAIPEGTLSKLLRIAWVGFGINILSGTALFTTQATTYVTDREFIIKMTFVVLGGTFVALLQNRVALSVRGGNATVATTDDSLARFYAYSALVSWLIATIAGRLIAYL
jgi:hypothetical protein